MRKKKYMPYNFNEKYEFKTYRNIGKNLKNSQNSIFSKIFCRCKRNKEQKKYKEFDTYLDWENYVLRYIECKLVYDSEYYENFIHFLKRRKRISKGEYNVVIGIVTPIYLALSSGAISVLSKAFEDLKIDILMQLEITWGIFSCILLTTFFIVSILNSKRKKIYYFYKDYLEITVKYKEKISITNE